MERGSEAPARRDTFSHRRQCMSMSCPKQTSKGSTVYHGKSNKTRCHIYRRLMSNTQNAGPIWNDYLYIPVYCERMFIELQRSLA